MEVNFDPPGCAVHSVPALLQSQCGAEAALQPLRHRMQLGPHVRLRRRLHLLPADRCLEVRGEIFCLGQPQWVEMTRHTLISAIKCALLQLNDGFANNHQLQEKLILLLELFLLTAWLGGAEIH